MRVQLTKDKPKCSTCVHSTPVTLGEGFLCDKHLNIIEDDLTCMQYTVAIDKIAEKRRHNLRLDKLQLAKIEIN